LEGMVWSCCIRGAPLGKEVGEHDQEGAEKRGARVAQSRALAAWRLSGEVGRLL